MSPMSSWMLTPKGQLKELLLRLNIANYTAIWTEVIPTCCLSN